MKNEKCFESTSLPQVNRWKTANNKQLVQQTLDRPQQLFSSVGLIKSCISFSTRVCTAKPWLTFVLCSHIASAAVTSTAVAKAAATAWNCLNEQKYMFEVTLSKKVTALPYLSYDDWSLLLDFDSVTTLQIWPIRYKYLAQWTIRWCFDRYNFFFNPILRVFKIALMLIILFTKFGQNFLRHFKQHWKT